MNFMEKNNSNLLKKFVLVFGALVLLHWALFVMNPEGVQKTVFFAKGNDFMADFLILYATAQEEIPMREP